MQKVFETRRLLHKEYRLDTATRKVGLSSSPRRRCRCWFVRWQDLIGECEQARGRLIGDDIKVAVLLERVPKDLRDHLVLESPQLANVNSNFPVMREFVQHWCRSRKTFALLRPSV